MNNSAEERFIKIMDKAEMLGMNFTVVHRSDFEWLVTWAEFGVASYKLSKQVPDDLGNRKAEKEEGV